MTTDVEPERAVDGDVTTYTYLCVGCPLGCRLELDESEQGDIVEVRGFACRRGREYAVQEHTDPRRMVTTTVTIEGGHWPRLPVKTTGQVPKRQVSDVCRSLTRISVKAPIRMGDVIAEDVLGTGTDVVATRDMSVSTR